LICLRRKGHCEVVSVRRQPNRIYDEVLRLKILVVGPGRSKVLKVSTGTNIIILRTLCN